MSTETYGTGANKSTVESPAPIKRVSTSNPTPDADWKAPKKGVPFPQPEIPGDDPQK